MIFCCIAVTSASFADNLSVTVYNNDLAVVRETRDMDFSKGIRGDCRTLVAVPCLLLWSALYGLGLVSEGRGQALRFELIRLLLIMPLGILGITRLGLAAADRTPLIWSGLCIYVVLSAAVLRPATGPCRLQRNKSSTFETIT